MLLEQGDDMNPLPAAFDKISPRVRSAHLVEMTSLEFCPIHETTVNGMVCDGFLHVFGGFWRLLVCFGLLLSGSGLFFAVLHRFDRIIRSDN